MLTSFNAALSVTSSYTSLPRPFMACPTLYIHLGTSRPFRTATTRRIYKNTVKDKVRMAIIKNPRLERKKFIILTSTLTIYPVIQDMTKTLLLPYRQGDCLHLYLLARIRYYVRLPFTFGEILDLFYRELMLTYLPTHRSI